LKRLNKKLFKDNPNLFFENIIKDYTETSPGNSLPSFDNDPIFEEPLVGFADGDDPIFDECKKNIGDSYLTPREAWRKVKSNENSPARLSIISIIFPITQKTRDSLRMENEVVSLRWHHTRFQGQAFINGLAQYVVSSIEKLGYQAVAPEQSPAFGWLELDNGPASNWSQRHVAYAAGLGTFSLNDGFITPKGIAMRCVSIVTDVVLVPSPRTYPSRVYNCLFYRTGSCGKCIQRCPAGALSEKGHDKKKCRAYTTGDLQKQRLKEMGREGYNLGPYPACGLCQTGVPCEDKIP
jgi:epoxyqueuosine reductase